MMINWFYQFELRVLSISLSLIVTWKRDNELRLLRLKSYDFENTEVARVCVLWKTRIYFYESFRAHESFF